MLMLKYFLKIKFINLSFDKNFENIKNITIPLSNLIEMKTFPIGKYNCI